MTPEKNKVLMAVRASNWLGRDVYDARLVAGRWQVRTNPNTYMQNGNSYHVYEDLSELLGGR